MIVKDQLGNHFLVVDNKLIELTSELTLQDINIASIDTDTDTYSAIKRVMDKDYSKFSQNILELLYSLGYKYVARDDDNSLYAYKEKPIRKKGYWFYEDKDDTSICELNGYPELNCKETLLNIKDLLGEEQHGN